MRTRNRWAAALVLAVAVSTAGVACHDNSNGKSNGVTTNGGGQQGTTGNTGGTQTNGTSAGGGVTGATGAGGNSSGSPADATPGASR
jgi:hypothetical protein